MKSDITWNVELGSLKPVELEMEAKTGSFNCDQYNQVDDRYGAWTQHSWVMQSQIEHQRNQA